MKYSNDTISASIVLYNNDLADIDKLVRCLEGIYSLFIIDNSPQNNLSIISRFLNIKYFHNPANPGFGSAHNIAIQKAIDSGFEYHFIINPDIYFEGDVISQMVAYMKSDPAIGMMMPEILNLDGSVQNLPKLLPNPLSILLRKLKKPAFYYKKFIDQYEFRFVRREAIYNAPILSGCFTLLNLKAVQEVGLYDDAYFMYFEDWDLSRRMHAKYKTIYFPKVSVYHGYDSGANKSLKLFKIYMNSALTYFNKWGWFFDSDRKKINKQALSQFK